MLAVATPLFAGLEPAGSTSAGKASTAPRSSSNLKWRTPKPATAATETPDTAAEASEKPAATPEASGPELSTPSRDESASAEPAATKKQPSQLSVRVTTDTKSTSAKSDAKPTVTKSTVATKAAATSSTKIVSGNKPSPVRSKVTRLSDASPSPHSNMGADTGTSSLRIVRTSNEELQLNPFADDKPVHRTADTRGKKRVTQAGLQDRGGLDPFGDGAPRLDSPPTLPPPRSEMDQLSQGPIKPSPGDCPDPKEYIKKLADVSTVIAPPPGALPQECGLGDEQFSPRNWQGTLYAWKASALCHKPLYFEDVELERYGQTCSPLLQPFISGAKFWLTVPILPYKMGLEPPCECIYPLGYYRPGSCAPFIIPPVPISVRGALLEAGVWVAGVALVP